MEPLKTIENLRKAVEATQGIIDKYKYNQLAFVFPDKGPYSREKYRKAIEFFTAGKDHRFRMIGGANGSGKSFNGAVELVYHITGLYPAWWSGKRQKNPRLWWIIAESGNTFKSSLQRLLLGPTLNDEDVGTGLIPKDRIVGFGHMQGVAGAVSWIQVRHVSGHTVTIEVKQSEQKRENLQAATLDGVLFDEEPPLDIYTECVFRLRGSPTKEPGISMLLFTPLKGLTEVVLKYLKDGAYPEYGEHPDDSDKYIVRIEMDEVPHLSEEDKRMYINESTPADVEARTKGIPALGAGKIYPIPESDIIVPSFKIPDFWPRAFGWDFGWHQTAGVWGAQEPNTGIIYLYAEYYKGQMPLAVHVASLREMGEWITGLADPSKGGRNENGELQMDLYIEKGIKFYPAINDFASGTARVLNAFQTGKLKVMAHLHNWRSEYRLYRYDEKNPNVAARNQKDHLMDATRYLLSRFHEVSQSYDDAHQDDYDEDWMYDRKFDSRDDLTGY